VKAPLFHNILYAALFAVLLLCLTSCVTERIEKRPVDRFAFAPEEDYGRNLGKRYSRSKHEILPRSQYTGRGGRQSETFVPARLERFSGNPQLIR
jgi:hypothetical protein